MEPRHHHSQTPWQRVYNKLGLPQSKLAEKLGRHRSKICRALQDERGMITGHDQAMLMKIAKAEGKNLTADDLLPRV